MIAVVTAAEARAGDEAAIARGIDSFDLMRRAGDRAAHLLLARYPEVRRGVQIFVGPGNNGGDGYVIAHALRHHGARVGVTGVPPKTPDAMRAMSLFGNDLPGVIDNPHVVIDALLGTGATGALRPEIAVLAAQIESAPSFRVALDLPSGLSASTGEAAAGTPTADLTITFGAWKRGQLVRRDLCGALACIDIGLPPFGSGIPRAVDHTVVAGVAPPINALASKRERKRLLVAGGAPGMAGATALAAAGALRSGIGMVRCAVHEVSRMPLQVLRPEAVVLSWTFERPTISDAEIGWPHAMVIGPGFGLDDGLARATQWLSLWRGPVVVDADALVVFEGEIPVLRNLLAGREAVITPHAVESARLLASRPDEVTADPFAAARALSAMLGCTVLLKGVPTVIASGNDVLVSSRGTPVLGTGGSGDLLAGIVGTLLAQSGDSHRAAAAGAWVHGRAAELAQGGRCARGTTLDDVLLAMRDVWDLVDEAHEEPWLLGTLPSVSSRVA